MTKAINTLQNQFSLYFTQRLQFQIFPQNSTLSQNYFHQLKKRRLGIQATQTLTSSNSEFAEIE